jgi:hypothetical protein
VARGAHTRDLVESILSRVEPEKHQKALQGSMAELKMGDLPRGASRAVCGAYLSLLREVSEHLELKRALAARQAVAGTKRKPEESGGGGEGEGEPRQEKRQRVAKKAFE